MHTFNYTLHLQWEKDAFYKRHYSRDCTITIQDKTPFAISADHHFFGNKSFVNPEEYLLSALATCHMLSFLHISYKANIEVLDYQDFPKGVLRFNSDGSGQFTEVSLYPKVRLKQEIDKQTYERMHAEAGAICFIARSCNFPIYYEPELI